VQGRITRSGEVEAETIRRAVCATPSEFETLLVCATVRNLDSATYVYHAYRLGLPLRAGDKESTG
jgi:hypothetical protein